MNLNDELNDAMELDNKAGEVLRQLRKYNSLLGEEDNSWSNGYKIDVCESVLKEMEEKVGIIVGEIDEKYSEVKRAQLIKNKMQEDLGHLKWRTLNITANLKRYNI